MVRPVTSVIEAGFYRKLENGVWQICETKIFDPDSVYEKSK